MKIKGRVDSKYPIDKRISLIVLNFKSKMKYWNKLLDFRKKWIKISNTFNISQNNTNAKPISLRKG